jgi:hypothetical protein
MSNQSWRQVPAYIKSPECPIKAETGTSLYKEIEPHKHQHKLERHASQSFGTPQTTISDPRCSKCLTQPTAAYRSTQDFLFPDPGVFPGGGVRLFINLTKPQKTCKQRGGIRIINKPTVRHFTSRPDQLCVQKCFLNIQEYNSTHENNA